MKDADRIDETVHELYEYVTKHVDCTKCANCCIVLETSFEKDEFEHMCKSFNLDKEEFINKNTKPGEPEEEDKIVLKDKPCMFLKDKKCTIYPLRPEECKSYPYLHKDDFITRLFGVVANYEICPIVYNVYELLKRRFYFR